MNCRNNTFSVTNLPPLPIFLGYPGENNSRPVSIDVSPWLEEFPDGSVSIDYTRADKLTYAVVANQPGPIVTWKPQRRDLVEGSCKIQLQIKQGDDVKMERIIACKVGESLDDPNDPPEEPRPTYVEEAISAADRAEAAVEHYPQIRDGELRVWNINTEQWEKLDVSGGSDSIVYVTGENILHVSMSASEILSAVENGKFPILKISGLLMPFSSMTDDGKAAFTVSAAGDNNVLDAITILVDDEKKTHIFMAVPVQSVNGQTGAVEVKEPFYLTVTTENGVTSVDKTPAEIDALSMAGYDVHARIPDVLGFVYDLRFVGYLASANLAVLASEYSGKSVSILVDENKAVEYSAIDFASRIDRIEVNVGNLETVKADKSEIPSLTGYATETWVEGKGYQTAQDVQTAIASKADKVPRVAMTAADEVVTLNPNTLYVFPEMASLTITLAAPADLSIVNEYHFIFTSGATATTLSIPATVNQPDGFTVDANMVYEVSILENNMTAMSWEVSA